MTVQRGTCLCGAHALSTAGKIFIDPKRASDMSAGMRRAQFAQQEG